MHIKEEVQKILEERLRSFILRVRCQLDEAGLETAHEYEIVPQGFVWAELDDLSVYAVSIRNVAHDDTELNRAWVRGQAIIPLAYTSSFYTHWLCVTVEPQPRNSARERYYLCPHQDIISMEQFEEKYKD